MIGVYMGIPRLLISIAAPPKLLLVVRYTTIVALPIVVIPVPTIIISVRLPALINRHIVASRLRITMILNSALFSLPIFQVYSLADSFVDFTILLLFRVSHVACLLGGSTCGLAVSLVSVWRLVGVQVRTIRDYCVRVI